MNESHKGEKNGLMSSEYLEGHLEPGGLGGIFHQGGRLSRKRARYEIEERSGEIKSREEQMVPEYSDIQGSFSFGDKYNSFFVSYSPTSRSKSFQVREMYYALHDSGRVTEDEKQKESHRRQIDELIITSKGLNSSESSTRTINVVALLPQGWRLEVETNPNWQETQDQERSVIEQDYGIIRLNIPINHPSAILEALYQIGREEDIARASEENPSYRREIFLINKQLKEKEIPLKDVELAKALLAQRNAWAYALKKIKPFLRDNDPRLNKKAVLKYIHNHSLSRFSKLIHSKRPHTLEYLMEYLTTLLN